MSDTFGAPPDGGSELQGDMPGIGAAQSSGPQLPSALGGLAQAFQQLFGGPPQQQQQPRQPPLLQSRLPPPPPDMPDTGSPTGPYPSWPPPWRPNRVQTYMPALPNRHYSEWGEPAPYEQTPNAWEVPGILQGAGKHLAQFGSGDVAALAMMFGPGAGAFLEAFAKGQSERTTRLHKQFMDNAEEAAVKQEERLRTYRDIFAAFGADPMTGEGVDEKKTIKGVGTMRDALWDAAQNDPWVQAALQTGDLKAVERILQERDAKGRDIRAALKAQKNDDKQREADAPFELNPSTPAGPPSDKGAGTGGYQVTPNGVILNATPLGPPQAPKAAPTAEPVSPDEGVTPDEDGTSEGTADDDGLTGDAGDGSDIERANRLLSPQGGLAQPPTTRPRVFDQSQADIPSPTAQPTQAVAPAQGDQFQTPGDTTANARQQPAAAWQPAPSKALAEGLNRTRPLDPLYINDTAQRILQGRAKPDEFKNNSPDIWPIASRRADEINNDLQAIRESNLTGDAVLNAVHSAAPRIAGDLKGVVDGVLPLPSGGGFGATLFPYTSLLNGLAHKTRPNWAPYNFQASAQFANPNGRTQLTLQRAATMTTAAQNLLTDINKLPDDPNRFKAMVDFYKLNGYAQDERYQRVFADWQAFAMESNVLRTGGTGSVTETEQMIQSLPLYASKAQYRAVVQRDIDVAESNLASKKLLWRRLQGQSGASMPGDMPGAEAAFRAIKSMNVNNGYMPGEVPAGLQGAIPQNTRDAIKYVRDNINSADPAIRAKALQVQQALTGDGQ